MNFWKLRLQLTSNTSFNFRHLWIFWLHFEQPKFLLQIYMELTGGNPSCNQGRGERLQIGYKGLYCTIVTIFMKTCQIILQLSVGILYFLSTFDQKYNIYLISELIYWITFRIIGGGASHRHAPVCNPLTRQESLISKLSSKLFQS